MRLLITVLFSLFIFDSAFAFRVHDGTKDLGNVNEVECSADLSCTKSSVNKLMLGLSATQGAGGIFLPATLPATTATLTGADCGKTFVNSAATAVNLPAPTAALVGCRITFLVGNASNLDLEPGTGITILPGTDASGDTLRGSAVGNSVTLQLLSTTVWATVAIAGTWSDED